MNEEYNNNQFGGPSGNNDLNPNAESQSYQGNEQNISSTYGANSYNTYNYSNSGDSQANYPRPDTIYPTPQVVKEKKPRKKRGIPKFIKLTAAAVVFGVIAGAAFQGYYMLTNTDLNKTATNNQNLNITEVAQNSEDTIAPPATSTNAVVTDVSDVVDSVMPSIVAINATGIESSYDFFGREFNQQVKGSGSGIIIGQNDQELLLVTNNHVIEGAATVEIVFADKSTASAVIKGADANADLAVLSVKMKDISEKTASAIKVATLGDSDKVEEGEMAIAIGNALGYGQSVTVGYISAVNREVPVLDKKMALIQTDAAINPGNSGGALLNIKGQVIGINTVKFANDNVEGMGYAIPISSAVPMINELMNRQTVAAGEQGFLGIDATAAQTVTEEFAERFNMPIGIYINDVIKNSPADKAGLKQGNIIVGLDNVTIKSIDDLVNVLSYKKAGQEIELKIKEKVGGEYKDKTLKVTLGKRN